MAAWQAAPIRRRRSCRRRRSRAARRSAPSARMFLLPWVAELLLTGPPLARGRLSSLSGGLRTRGLPRTLPCFDVAEPVPHMAARFEVLRAGALVVPRVDRRQRDGFAGGEVRWTQVYRQGRHPSSDS